MILLGHQSNVFLLINFLVADINNRNVYFYFPKISISLFIYFPFKKKSAFPVYLLDSNQLFLNRREISHDVIIFSQLCC